MPRDVYSLRAAVWLRRHCPPSWLGAVSNLVGDAIWTAQPRRRQTLALNMRYLMGADASVRPERFARQVFRHLARCNADLLAVPELTADAVLAWISTSGFEVLRDARRAGRGVLVVGAHLGNFELAAIGIAALAGPASVLVESIEPDRDALLARCRTATGLSLIPAGPRAPREALRVLRRGEVLIVAGDRALASSARRMVPFARGQRPMPEGPAWLATRSGATIVTGYVVRTPGAARPYRGVFEPVLQTDDLGADPVGTLTARFAARLGAAAERYPDQWFVFDPGWTESA